MPIHLEGDDPDAPPCPKCGAKTRKRTSIWSGEFWGCSKFPDCKGIVSIPSEYDVSDKFDAHISREVRSISRDVLSGALGD